MKALSVRQPWASLIATTKDVENRTWYTRHRGPLLIVSSRAVDHHPNLPAGARLPDDGMPRGVAVCVVDLVDVVRDHRSPWAEPDCWHWVLANPRRTNPTRVAGRLGLFDVNLADPGPVGEPSGPPVACQRAPEQASLFS